MGESFKPIKIILLFRTPSHAINIFTSEFIINPIRPNLSPRVDILIESLTPYKSYDFNKGVNKKDYHSFQLENLL